MEGSVCRMHPIARVLCSTLVLMPHVCLHREQGSSASVATGTRSGGGTGGSGGVSLGDRVARYGRVLLVTAVVAFKIVEWWNRVEAQVRWLRLGCGCGGSGIAGVQSCTSTSCLLLCPQMERSIAPRPCFWQVPRLRVGALWYL